MGLMKISTYHKMLGDEVRFFKGDFLDFITEQIYEETLESLYRSDDSINWAEYKQLILQYIKKGLNTKYILLSELSKNKDVGDILKKYRKYFSKKEYFQNPKWDRIYIFTLFSFYWDTTVNAINGFKLLCKDISEVKVGGIAASLLPDEIKKETEIQPHVGLLDKAGQYDDNDIIIDHLPLDYSILDEIDYEYPENDGYHAYMTRGCINQCGFCAVPKLEPTYNCFISIKDQIQYVSEKFGEKRNLILLDNNVFASERFDEIIDEIKECGFYRGATYVEPNKYAILIEELKQLDINYRGHIKSIIKLYKQLYEKVSSEELKAQIYNILSKNRLTCSDSAKKETILELDKFFNPLFYKHKSKGVKLRHVDFNQGVDARLVTPAKIKKLSEIPIRPLRVAFDYWSLRDVYENALILAVQNGIKHISNYLLYNYNDKPVELYWRLKLNIELCETLNINIYSFPMKYHPIQEKEYFKNRSYVGKHWNRKFIRSVQAILNSTKGKIGRGKQFFEKAFGIDELEYEKLLYMPETMIIYRLYYEDIGLVDAWWNAFSSLSPEKLESLKCIIHNNEFDNLEALSQDDEITKVLEFYTINRRDAKTAIDMYNNLKEEKNL